MDDGRRRDRSPQALGQARRALTDARTDDDLIDRVGSTSTLLDWRTPFADDLGPWET